MAEKKQQKSRLEKILEKEGITQEEAITAIKSSRCKPSVDYKVTIPKKHFKYLYMSDTHIGHKKFLPELFYKAVKLGKQESIDFIVNTGDHLEGMSGRPGHIYELDQRF